MKRLYVIVGLVAALLIGGVVGSRLFPATSAAELHNRPAAPDTTQDRRVEALLSIYRTNAPDPAKGDPLGRDRKRRLAEDALAREDPLALQLEQAKEEGGDRASEKAEIDALIANEGGR